MKNVAVLYYGIHQGYCFNECFLNFKEKVIEPNKKEYNFDIFMHRWVYVDSHKDWLPWYNSDRINDESIKIDEDFLFKEVKPKIIKKEPFIDFTLKEYNNQIGENYFYEYNLLKSKKSKKYIIYNMVSRCYSIMQVNNIKNKYEKDNNINYDIVILQESYNYYFDELKLYKINLNILNICGLWPKNLIVPKFFKTQCAGYKMKGGIHDILVIGNSEKINLFCNLYNKLNLYLELPLLKTEYKDYNYHQSGNYSSHTPDLFWRQITQRISGGTKYAYEVGTSNQGISDEKIGVTLPGRPPGKSAALGGTKYAYEVGGE